MIRTRKQTPASGRQDICAQMKPHPQSGTVAGEMELWYLAMLDYYAGEAKCQGCFIQDWIHGRFSQWR